MTGLAAAYEIQGLQGKGVITHLKHFAFNECETERNGIGIWLNEQEARELLLTPFEIAVTKGDTGAIMSSFNRLGATWAGGSKALMTNVLRDEWGFRGVGISDFNLYGYMFADQGTRAGTDMQLSFSKPFADTTSATARIAIRKALKNMLYMTANSNAMNHVAPGTIISYTTSPFTSLYVTTATKVTGTVSKVVLTDNKRPYLLLL